MTRGTDPAPHPRIALLNPVTPGARSRPDLEMRLARAGADEVRITAAPGDATRLAREAAAANAGTLIVAGGDGTLHEVVDGLPPSGGGASGPRLALVPLGTGNDLARALGIPLDPEAAMRLLEEGEPGPLDLVAVTGAARTRLANFAMGGFGGRIGERVTPRRRRVWGRHVYLRAAVDEIVSRRARRATVRVDGREFARGDVLAVLVANGPRFGGGIPMAPGARVDDGLLEVLVLGAVSLPVLLRVVGRALRGRHLEDPAVLRARARRVEVEAEPGMPWNGDGELIGAGSAAFEILPRAVQVQRAVGPGSVGSDTRGSVPG